MGRGGRSSGKRKSSRLPALQLPSALTHSQSERSAATTGVLAEHSGLHAGPGDSSGTAEAENMGRTYHEYAMSNSPAGGRQQQHRFLERQMSDYCVGDELRSRGVSESKALAPRRRRSIDSYRSRSGSENPNLASAISHYMHGIDAESATDMLAARYYGNMAQIPEDADRQPRPMNSTLPLFSLSVMNGARKLHSQSPQGSDRSSRRRRGRPVRARTSVDGVFADLAPLPVPAHRAAQGELAETSQSRRRADAGPVADAAYSDNLPVYRGYEAEDRRDKEPAAQVPTMSNEAEAQSALNDLPPHESTAHPPDAEPVQRADSLSDEDSPLSLLPYHRLSQSDMPPPVPEVPAMGIVLPPLASTQTTTCAPFRRQSISGYGFIADANEHIDGLGLQTASRSSSQARGSRKQPAGAIQYKPAAATKKTVVARGAPGFSYMFSPTIGASRPASAVGIPAPHTPLLPPREALAAVSGHRSMSQAPMVSSPHSLARFPIDEQHYVAGLANADGDMASGSAVAADATQAPEFIAKAAHKKFGSINIGALEQFLEEGEIPDSTTDDDSSADDASWEEDYPGSSANSTGQSTCSSTRDRLIQNSVASIRQVSQQVLSRSPESNGPRGAMLPPGSLQHMPALGASQFSPRVRSVGRSSLPDERMPLLHSAVTVSPPQYGTEMSHLIVPADLPNLDDLHHRNSSPRVPERLLKPTGGRRRNRGLGRGCNRKHHEELFLDKDGFIDESYRFTFFNPAIGTIRAQEFADLRTPGMDLAALLQVGGCFWIDVLRPSFQEMHLFSKIFGIHALTVEDIMTQDAREKCEVHATYYFVCFRSFDNDPNSESYLEPKCIYNIVMREGIITFHMDPAVHQYHVLRRIRRQIDHIIVTPDWLNYAIIDDITDLLAPILQVVEFDVDSIDELVLVISSSEQSDMLLRISTARKRVMMVLRLLQGKADVVRALTKRFETATALSTSQINAMAGTGAVHGLVTERQNTGTPSICDNSSRWRRASNGDHAWTAPPVDAPDVVAEMALDQRKGHETLLYLGDVLDHIVTMMQNAAHYDNILGRAHANYLAQISIDLTESSNRTNDVVAKLSALAAIVVPLNFITGMWGANVKVPGQGNDDLHYFFTILGMCMLYVIVAISWARYYKIF